MVEHRLCACKILKNENTRAKKGDAAKFHSRDESFVPRENLPSAGMPQKKNESDDIID
jgi:hypothetical protein